MQSHEPVRQPLQDLQTVPAVQLDAQFFNCLESAGDPISPPQHSPLSLAGLLRRRLFLRFLAPSVQAAARPRLSSRLLMLFLCISLG